MADTTTVLNPGVGGDVMDESLVTQSGGTPAKRPRVVLGFDDGTLVETAHPLPVVLENGSFTIGTVVQGTGGNSAWKTDGSAVTQPVSAASLPLPTGAATQTTLASILAALAGIALDATIQAIRDRLPSSLVGGRLDVNVGAGTVSVGNFPGSQAVTGTFFQATQPVSRSPERSTLGATVGVLVSTSAVQLFVSNSSARARIVSNNAASGNVYLGRSSAVTSSGATMGMKLSPGGVYGDSGEDLDTGAIWAIGDTVTVVENVCAWEKT